MEEDFSAIIFKIRELFNEPDALIPLHAPYFGGNEKKYVLDTIESTFVSSVGAYVTLFEEMMQEITGAKYAIATTNGTTAIQLALLVAGLQKGDEVITQSLTFVATANAISHAGGKPVFVDVDLDTMGLSPVALESFLKEHTAKDTLGNCVNRKTGNRIRACIPMHTFGFPAKIDQIVQLCAEYNILTIEDAAESLGSFYKGIHTGHFGAMGTFSFNGNKTVTSGGGGAIITDNLEFARKAKHLSTTAKQPHQWEFYHDQIGFNYRMPNLNAALACAQLEQLPNILNNKRALADSYKSFFASRGEKLITEIAQASANNWLNTIVLPNKEKRDAFLTFTNAHNIMTRPIWRLMNDLPMYHHCFSGSLPNSKWLEERVVNLPSSFRPGQGVNNDLPKVTTEYSKLK